MNAFSNFYRQHKVDRDMAQPTKSELPFAPVVQPPKLRFRVVTLSSKTSGEQVSIRSTQSAAMACARYDCHKPFNKSVKLYDDHKSDTVPIWEWKRPGTR